MEAGLGGPLLIQLQYTRNLWQGEFATVRKMSRISRNQENIASFRYNSHLDMFAASFLRSEKENLWHDNNLWAHALPCFPWLRFNRYVNGDVQLIIALWNFFTRSSPKTFILFTVCGWILEDAFFCWQGPDYYNFFYIWVRDCRRLVCAQCIRPCCDRHWESLTVLTLLSAQTPLSTFWKGGTNGTALSFNVAFCIWLASRLMSLSSILMCFCPHN